MKLTPEQQAMLDGAQGETMAKVVRTLVMYGDAFGAERMVPITGKCGHTVISFGLKAIQPVYELYDQLIAAGLTAGQKFTADPRPIDPAVPTSLLEDIVFKKIMYTRQKEYEAQGLFLRPRFSPGYGDLKLDHQKDWFRLLDISKQIGVELTDSLLMVPTKSVTALIGIGIDKSKAGCSSCSGCNKHDTCAFSKEDK